MYVLTWTLEQDQYSVDLYDYRSAKGIIALLEVLEIPYTLRYEPPIVTLPGD